MAVCKIIPIKQSQGVGQCLDYISDEKKVIANQKNNEESPLRSASQMDAEEEEKIIAPLDFNTVLAYMANDEKTHRTDDLNEKYVSGYLCTPESAVQDFLDVKQENLKNQEKTLEDETGNWAYHIIQSFPEGLNISDEEVHQCGRELCEKLNAYQAVICSHVHPVIDEDNEVKGKCKHNHILINSHIHPSKIDPTKPEVFKYNDCKATYMQLQKWNDEISLAHGLPIIRNPETGKKYSWYKSKKENEGTSWPQQVAIDIKNTMRFSTGWEQFKTLMEEQGYRIREAGKTITYYSPDHSETNKQQIREMRLGKEYTKAALEQYWATIGKAKEAPITKVNTAKVRLIRDLVRQYDTNLFAEVVLQRKRGKKEPYILDVPLKSPHRQLAEETLSTYFEADKTYNLCTFDHVSLAEVTGKDLFDYYNMLRKEREKQEKENAARIESEEFYYEESKKDSETQKPYKIRLWDTNGRRRTTIELMCILALVVIKKEHGESTLDTKSSAVIRGTDGEFIYAKRDWKIQNMYNTMAMAKEMKVENGADVDKKLDRAGKEIARLRKQVNLLTEQHNQMQTIYENLQAMQAVKAVCEQIYNMPDGEEKDSALAAHAADLEQYKTSKRYLHMKNINTDDQIAEFTQRYLSTTNHLKNLQEDLTNMNQEYRNLKKIEHSIALTQNNYYCYGPTHPQLVAAMQKNEPQNPPKNVE